MRRAPPKSLGRPSRRYINTPVRKKRIRPSRRGAPLGPPRAVWGPGAGDLPKRLLRLLGPAAGAGDPWASRSQTVLAAFSAELAFSQVENVGSRFHSRRQRQAREHF